MMEAMFAGMGGYGDYDFDMGDYDFGSSTGYGDYDFDMGDYGDYDFGGPSEEELEAMMMEVLMGLIPADADCQDADLMAMMNVDEDAPEPTTVEEAMAYGLTETCAECGLQYAGDDDRRLMKGRFRRLEGHEADPIMTDCFGIDEQEMEA